MSIIEIEGCEAKLEHGWEDTMRLGKKVFIRYLSIGAGGVCIDLFMATNTGLSQQS